MRTYTRWLKFHHAPSGAYRRLRAIIFQSQIGPCIYIYISTSNGGIPPANPSLACSNPFRSAPEHNSCRSCLVWRVRARVSSTCYCLGCKFFACIRAPGPLLRPYPAALQGVHRVDLLLPLLSSRGSSACHARVPRQMLVFAYTTVRLICCSLIGEMEKLPDTRVNNGISPNFLFISAC